MSETVGILGAGAMGSGIAQVAATAGWQVRLMDRNGDIVSKAIAGVGARLDRLVTKGRLEQATAEEIKTRLHVATEPEAMRDCDVLIEAVVEDIDAKAAAYLPLIKHAPDDAIIATNTSSLSVTEIGDRLGVPDRIVGMHFFNPAPIMKLVEIIRGRNTDEQIVDRATIIALDWGKQVAHAADTPGFIVNRVARPYYLEAFRCLEDGLGTADLIDETMKTMGGFRMGPLALTDFIGHDVNTATTRSVWTQWNKPSRLRPVLAQEQLVAEGSLGRKTGQGVYDYSGDTPVAVIRPGHDALTFTSDTAAPINAFCRKASDHEGDPVEQFIFARILCALFNEARWARADGVAQTDDIDTAMKFGVNYPKGPFEWMASIGDDIVQQTMQVLENMTGDGRFVPPANDVQPEEETPPPDPESAVREWTRHPDTATPTIRLGKIEEDIIDLPPHLQLEPGDEVGPYHIISLVAEGGFGIVYLAQQHQPVRRRVALKIIKPGMDTRAVIARFEAERQALAILDHPGIATVFDAGATSDGRPFFVMEYVEGEPITDYCDDHRLDMTQRLKLLIDVCAAVQHAHMKGIIHRDLKPSNILVLTDSDGNPHPKVIDFGVAKATSVELTEHSFCTETGQLIGTPEYMSPEQADLGSVDVDTRSDVYSLGMILYELVTGTLPFESIKMRQAGFSELCRIIQEDEPPKPSTRLMSLGSEASKVATSRRSRPADLASQLRKELEWIPLKALRKDRDERYDSATALAEDMRRYLSGDVLKAGPETTRYRLRKFLKRNRSGVLAGAFVFLSLLVGLNVSLLMLRRARAGEQQFSQQLSISKQLQSELQLQQSRLHEELARTQSAESLAKKRATEAEQANLKLQALTYVSNLNNADRSIEAGRLSEARTLLLTAADGLDGERPFEWRHLWAQAEPSLAVLSDPEDHDVRAWITSDDQTVFTMSPDRFSRWTLGEAGPTRWSVDLPVQNPGDVRIAADGRTALLGVVNGHRNLIETESGRVITMIPTPPGAIDDVSFSGDGRRLVSFISPTRVRVLDTRTARTIAELDVPTGTRKVVLDTTGSRLATQALDRVHVLNVPTGTASLAPLRHPLDVTAVAFDHALTRLATTTTDGHLRLWDMHTGRKLTSIQAPIRNITAATFSPDGDLLHLQNARGDDVLIDTRSGVVLREPTGVWTLTEDWSSLASSDGPTRIRIDRLDRPQAVVRLEIDSPTALAFSDDGHRLVTADASGNIAVWDLDESPPMATLIGHGEGPVSMLAFADRGRSVLSTDRTGPRLWSATGRHRVESIDLSAHPLATISFNQDGSRLFAGTQDGHLAVIDPTTGDLIAAIAGHEGEITNVLVAPDAGRAVTTARDNTARLWDLRTGHEIVRTDYPFWSPTPVRTSPAGDRVLLPGKGTTLKILDLISGEPVATLSGHETPVVRALFSPRGDHLATVGEDGVIRVWQTETGTVQAKIDRSDDGAVLLAFADQGGSLVTGGESGFIRVWSTTGGRELLNRMIPISKPIAAITLAPDGDHLAIGLNTGSIEVRSLNSGELIAGLMGTSSAQRELTWSPDGGVLLAQGTDGSLRAWNSDGWSLGVDLPGMIADLQIRAVDRDMTRVADVTSGTGITLLDLRSGETLFTIQDPTEDVTLLAFSPRGDRLISGDAAGHLRVWNTLTRGQADRRIQQIRLEQDRLGPVATGWIEAAAGDPVRLDALIRRELRTRPTRQAEILTGLVLQQLQSTSN